MQDALVLDFGGVISRTLFETHDLSEKKIGGSVGHFCWWREKWLFQIGLLIS